MAERNISPELKKNYQIVDDYCKGELKAMPDRIEYAEELYQQILEGK